MHKLACMCLQGRVTDHRANVTVHNLDNVMAGPGLVPLIEAVSAQRQAEALVVLSESYADS